uniref:Rac GTPase-activating protein 1 n=1 Tax=Panagrolaimus sp. ES5 TaxID=591445 RepID=A0AC34FEQ1_9BILA
MPPTAAPSKKLCTTESESIGREFIDNWSHYISLLETNSERDVLELLALLESVRVKWQQSEAAANHYKDKLITSEDNNRKLVKENERLKFELLNCQSQLDHVQSIKHDVEKELDEYKNQWEKLRGIIKESDQSFIADGLLALMNNVQRSNSVRRNVTQEVTTTRTHFETEDADEVSTMESTQSDIDYDRTGDSLDSSFDHPRRASRKRRSRSQAPEASRTTVRFGHSSIKEEPELESAPSKRSRNAEDTEITATIRIDPSGQRKPSANVQIRRSMNRSMSESTLVEKREKIAMKPKAMTPHYAAGRSTYDLRSPYGFAGSWTRGQDIERRTHRVRTFIPVFEACDVCTKRFGITAQNALKCVDCNIRFHRHCQSRAPMPCVPKVPMPKTPSKQRCPLVQYCPDTHPYIPPIMIHCIVALERDRLTKEGIYRLPGADQAVAKLYQEFMSGRQVPNLSNVETENITGCLKKFLRELRDSLIPSTSYDDFIRAVEANDEQQLIQSIFELSAPNRDTLAYFVLHLQKVAKNSSHNKMPIENLARVLAPTVVGYSKLVTPCVENVNELNRNQYMILLRLLKIPSEFWSRFIENNMSAVLAAEARTPGSKTALLTVTPTKPSSSSSRRAGFNNNTTMMEFQSEESTQKSANSSPLIQPLSMASSTMRGISFKPAF